MPPIPEETECPEYAFIQGCREVFIDRLGLRKQYWASIRGAVAGQYDLCYCQNAAKAHWYERPIEDPAQVLRG